MVDEGNSEQEDFDAMVESDNEERPGDEEGGSSCIKSYVRIHRIAAARVAHSGMPKR